MCCTCFFSNLIFIFVEKWFKLHLSPLAMAFHQSPRLTQAGLRAIFCSLMALPTSPPERSSEKPSSNKLLRANRIFSNPLEPLPYSPR